MFFVLSAYLITGQLLTRAGEPAQLKNFYWRRAFRLFPALVVFIVFIGTPTAISAHEASKLPVSIGGSLLYLNDFLMAFTHSIANAFDQTWSLAVEEQFYLVWPALLLFGISKLRRGVQGAVLAALVVLGLALLFRGGNYFLPTGHLFALALGCAAAWARHQGWRLTLPWPVPWVAAAVLALAVVAPVHLRPRSPTGGWPSRTSPPSHWSSRSTSPRTRGCRGGSVAPHQSGSARGPMRSTSTD